MNAVQLAAEDHLAHIAIAVSAAAAWAIWRYGIRRKPKPVEPEHAAVEQQLRETGTDLSGITPEAHARIRDRVVGPGEERAAVRGRRVRSGWPRSTPLPPLDDLDTTDYVKRVVEHQPCTGWPCDHTQWHTNTAAAYTPHCRCGRARPCPLSGPLNIPRQRDGGEPFNRQDDPGRGWW